MTILDEHFTILVEQVPRQTARLSAGTTIGTAVTDILAQIALSAMADTKRAVHEKLQWYRGLLTYLPNLLQA